MKIRKQHKPSLRLSIDKETFEETKSILESINLTLGQVVSMMCNQIVLHRKVPFEIKAKDVDQQKSNDSV